MNTNMNPLITAAANRIIKYYGITSPEEINLIDIAADRNIIVEEKIIRGAEGRIVQNKDGAIIVINSEIKEDGKKHFVLAHEFGHFELHRKITHFICDDEALLDWHNSNSREYEANTFAAEILMPKEIFIKECYSKKFSLDLIKELSSTFKTSITATAFRYAEIGSTPIVIAFSTNNKIKWYRCHKEFPLQFVSVNTDVSKDSYAFDFFQLGTVPVEPDKVPAYAWFQSDYHCHEYDFFNEQCHVLPRYNSVLSIIW